MACGTSSSARKVRSTTAPERRFLSFMRTNARPLPGFTCWCSTIWNSPSGRSSAIPDLTSLWRPCPHCKAFPNRSDSHPCPGNVTAIWHHVGHERKRQGNPGRQRPVAGPGAVLPLRRTGPVLGAGSAGPGDEGPPSRAGPPSIHGGPVHAQRRQGLRSADRSRADHPGPERDHQRHPGQGEDLAEQRLSGRHPRHRAAPAPLG